MWAFLSDGQFVRASQGPNTFQCFPCTGVVSHLLCQEYHKDMPYTAHNRDQNPKWGSGTYGRCLIYTQTTNTSSLHRMPPLLLTLTPPCELWLPYNTLSKGNNIHLFPFPCTPISTLPLVIIFRVNCVICALLKMSLCHWSCSIAPGVLLRLCPNALDLALKGEILSGSFWSQQHSQPAADSVPSLPGCEDESLTLIPKALFNSLGREYRSYQNPDSSQLLCS